MSSWRDISLSTIAAALAGLPPDATLEQKRAAIDAAYPFGQRSHWPYKAWLAARRDVLSRLGWRRRMPPTPIEEAIRRGNHAGQPS